MNSLELQFRLDSGMRVPEAEMTRSAGIALLVVGLDPKRNDANQSDPLIWTIRELQDKPSSQKKAGELSIPAETRKTGEDRFSNLLGALAEFCDDDALHYVREHLFLVEDLFGERCLSINDCLVDLTTLVYDGDLRYPLTPLHSSEVGSNGWVNKSLIQGSDGVRTILSQALTQDTTQQLTSSIVDIYNVNPDAIRPVFPLGFKSMSSFFRSRELFVDAPLAKS
jgi:hypothetical protein